MAVDYDFGDIVEMKKPHPCQSRSTSFEIIRMGADIKIKCQGCDGILTFTRREFNQKMKGLIQKAN